MSDINNLFAGGEYMTRTRILNLLIAILVFCSVQTTTSLAQDAADAGISPCDRAEARQFDFWIGEWDLTWSDTVKGTNIITSELGNCVIEENFTSHENKPFIGHSLSVYNARLGKWQQTWVDNNGSYLEFLGDWFDGKMTLSRETVSKDGKLIQQRMIFHDITRKSLIWDWQSSDDNGHTWKTLWTINYKRKK